MSLLKLFAAKHKAKSSWNEYNEKLRSLVVTAISYMHLIKKRLFILKVNSRMRTFYMCSKEKFANKKVNAVYSIYCE